MPKGGKQPGAGRPKGSQSRTTVEFKEAVNNLISFATPQMVKWLEIVAAEDPNKALDHIYKFAQFGYPLLARVDGQQEHSHKHYVYDTAIRGAPNASDKDNSSI